MLRARIQGEDTGRDTGRGYGDHHQRQTFTTLAVQDIMDGRRVERTDSFQIPASSEVLGDKEINFGKQCVCIRPPFELGMHECRAVMGIAVNHFLGAVSGYAHHFSRGKPSFEEPAGPFVPKVMPMKIFNGTGFKKPLPPNFKLGIRNIEDFLI